MTVEAMKAGHQDLPARPGYRDEASQQGIEMGIDNACQERKIHSNRWCHGHRSKLRSKHCKVWCTFRLVFSKHKEV